MRLLICFLLGTLTVGSLTARPVTSADLSSPLTALAFGSCNRSTKPQTLWETVTASGVDLWVWGGDNIYPDAGDIEDLRARYHRLFHDPLYRTFRENTPVIGIWDDHDYGINNGHASNPIREAAEVALLDFLEEPPDSPRRQRPGIYTVYRFGPPEQQVRILLLDTRYFSDPPGKTADLLGKPQWQWLEAELKQNTAQVTLIFSGIQVIASDHSYEKWANFPQARQRLLELIQQTETPGVIFCSGDRHVDELSMQHDASVPYPLYDLTASGMTHFWHNFPGEPNRYRVGPVFTGFSFGRIAFDWDAPLPAVTLQIINDAGKAVIEQRIPLQNLQPTHTKANARGKQRDPRP